MSLDRVALGFEVVDFAPLVLTRQDWMAVGRIHSFGEAEAIVTGRKMIVQNEQEAHIGLVELSQSTETVVVKEEASDSSAVDEVMVYELQGSKGRCILARGSVCEDAGLPTFAQLLRARHEMVGRLD